MSIGSSYPVSRPALGPQPARPLPEDRTAAHPGWRLLGAALCGLLALGLTGVVFL